MNPAALQVEQAAKTADLGICAGAARGAHQRADILDHRIAGVDVDARIGIGQRLVAGNSEDTALACG